MWETADSVTLTNQSTKFGSLRCAARSSVRSVPETRSPTQGVISFSSGESELYAATRAACGIPRQQSLTETGCHQSVRVHRQTGRCEPESSRRRIGMTVAWISWTRVTSCLVRATDNGNASTREEPRVEQLNTTTAVCGSAGEDTRQAISCNKSA